MEGVTPEGMDLQELFIQAILVAVIIAVLRAVVQRIPGPIGRLGLYL